ncbi:MAG TPA: AI-2E family transporter [Candidatus Angelobacter sp.]|nr:AI-2E family transporter [Candidatus Angelobacter sp.]
MAFPDRRTANVLLTILLFAGVLAVVYIARAVLVIFCFSILFAYLINPVVRFLQRHSLLFRNLRGPHVAEAYLALLILVALLGYTLAPGLLGRTGKLLRELPLLSDRVATGEIATQIGHEYGWDEDRTLRVKTFLVQHRSSIQNVLGSIAQFATTALAALAVIPILAIFFLGDGQKLADQLIRMAAGKNNYQRVRSLADELHVMLQHYIRAKVILGVFSFAFASLALLILGVPHALALGILAGCLEFIPIAGWMTAAAIIVGVAVLTHSHWIWIAVLLGIWRMLMDYWIAPRVFGHELEIHPILAILTLMIGGAIGGLPGAYLSLPIAAVIRVVWIWLGHSCAQQDASEATLSLAASRAAD